VILLKGACIICIRLLYRRERTRFVEGDVNFNAEVTPKGTDVDLAIRFH
jgi:hypothetical protein